MKTMLLIRKLEKLILAVILGLIAPTIGLLAFWWGAVPFLLEDWIPLTALTGMALGLLVDVLFLKRWVRRAHQLDIKLWMAIYLFYSMCVFGFFMGVPVFNPLLAIPAGFVVGGRLAEEGADSLRVQKAAQRTAWFTMIILFLICIASAFIALASPSTLYDLQAMLGLGFEVTQGMVIGLIVVGGLTLLALGWGLAIAAVRFSFTFLQRKV
ncbi:MAG: hypothetical protein AB1531_00810 [Chloroflexota bacterium]